MESSLTLGETFGSHRTLPFVPAQLTASPPRQLSARMLTVQYEVRSIDGAVAHAVANDPMAAAPVPILRLLVNAMATFVLVLAGGLGVAAAAPSLLGYSSVVVVSGSMEPAIRVADIVVTAPSNGEGLGEGAVINYDYNGTTRLHRVAGLVTGGYRTAGDANSVADSEIVAPSQIHGVGVVVVPFVGLPATWIEQGRWVPLVITFLVLVAALYTSRSNWTKPRSTRFSS